MKGIIFNCNLNNRKNTWLYVKRFEQETERIAFDRQGGVPGIARKFAQEEVAWFDRVTTWSYMNAYIPSYRRRRNLLKIDMLKMSNAEEY
ncbi:CNT_collapsed_G0035460.mRNA.1.CDS.1 [Saccharomyces cerevisiae]|nr:CNT_collapsed_G0035460.mRNA.1.CDS.1 [Saccharomyces cerevisiae]